VPIRVELGIRIRDNIWSIVFETQVFRKFGVLFKAHAYAIGKYFGSYFRYHLNMVITS
jgi:hypothetical protein